MPDQIQRAGAAHGTETSTPPVPIVVVVGGGIAGLSAAWELVSRAPGTRVVLVESDERLGGKLRTGEIGGRAVDLGPDAFLARRPEALQLCHELGLDADLVSPGSRTAYVWARQRLRPLPADLALGVPTRLGPLARSGILSPLGTGRAALDLLRLPRRRGPAATGADEPVAAITRRRLGCEVTDRLVDPLIGGIHAGDTSLMSAAAVFPDLLDAARRGGSLMRALRHDSAPGQGSGPVFQSVRGGLSRLVEALAGALDARGVKTLLGSPAASLTRRCSDGPGWTLRTGRDTVEADAVVLAVPATAAAALLEPVDRAVAGLLGAITYAHVALLTLRFPIERVGYRLDGTGFLVPASAGCLMTACTWLTSKWPELRRPGDVLLRASVGRFGDDRATHMADDEVVRTVLAELGPMLELSAGPTDAVVTRWVDAFPQYAVGHVDRVTAIEDGLAPLPALALAGAALRGVGIPACIASGRRAAGTVLGRLARPERTSR
jgi:protoporphyrinogen/coproporphyrinogen III oxidase